MILKDGKFWDDKGNVVTMEHGNKEQIKILDAVSKAIDKGILPNVTVVKKVSIEFDCPSCGSTVEFDDIETEDEDDPIDWAVQCETDKCHVCKTEFIAFMDKLQGVMVRIKTDKKK